MDCFQQQQQQQACDHDKRRLGQAPSGLIARRASRARFFLSAVVLVSNARPGSGLIIPAAQVCAQSLTSMTEGLGAT